MAILILIAKLCRMEAAPETVLPWDPDQSEGTLKLNTEGLLESSKDTMTSNRYPDSKTAEASGDPSEKHRIRSRYSGSKREKYGRCYQARQS